MSFLDSIIAQIDISIIMTALATAALVFAIFQLWFSLMTKNYSKIASRIWGLKEFNYNQKVQYIRSLLDPIKN